MHYLTKLSQLSFYVNGLKYKQVLPNFLLSKGLDLETQSLKYYSVIVVTTPEPTVLPPSLIANLNPSCIATGVISSTFMSM
jgi:hypothetical protein